MSQSPFTALLRVRHLQFLSRRLLCEVRCHVIRVVVIPWSLFGWRRVRLELCAGYPEMHSGLVLRCWSWLLHSMLATTVTVVDYSHLAGGMVTTWRTTREIYLDINANVTNDILRVTTILRAPSPPVPAAGAIPGETVWHVVMAMTYYYSPLKD